jgi:hypothetical protein
MVVLAALLEALRVVETEVLVVMVLVQEQQVDQAVLI